MYVQEENRIDIVIIYNIQCNNIMQVDKIDIII